MAFTADAVENSVLVESPGELQITTSKAYKLALKEEDLRKALQRVTDKPMRIRVMVGETVVAQTPIARPVAEDEVESRALANPEVQRFRDVFGGEVRKVRNLKES